MPKRFFTYKTLESLQEEIARLHAPVRLETDLKACFEPLHIRHRTAGNRLAVHPMEGCDGTADGKPGELTIRRWERFGAGGAKLIWGEATAVSEESRANKRQLLINDANLSALEATLLKTRKAHRDVFGGDGDLLVGLQLTHSGRYSFKKPLIAQRDPDVDAVTKGVAGAETYPILADWELQKAADQIVHAAAMAAKIGFDFVDIKQCHRYLLSELLAARLRPGPYGGSYENRTRLAREIILRVKEEIGQDTLIGTRLNVYDGIPYGENLDTKEGEPKPVSSPYLGGWGVDAENPIQPDYSEPTRYAKDLAEWGVDIINATMGSPYYNPHVGRPFERPPIDGYTTPEHPLFGVIRHFEAAEAIQRAAPDVPVIGTGYSWLQRFFIYAAEANIRDGRVSAVGVGRGALAYPDFALDAQRDGELSRQKSCVAVSYCTALMRGKHNELGQFPAGCVPRDKIYAEIYKTMLATDPSKIES